MKTLRSIPISVVISAYNEEAKIADCLSSVNWADEVIVIDNSSTDKTAKIAQNKGAIVYKRPNNIMLNISKNYGFTKAKYDWIFSLDADERVSPELKDEIINRFTDDSLQLPNGYWIPRKNIIFGKWIQHSIWWPDYQLRLFMKNQGKFPEIDVHEMIEIKGSTDKLKNPLIHFNYDSITQYIHKVDSIYTENEANKILKSNRDLAWYEAIRMPVQDFLKTFFFQSGYKDGLHGLVLSILQAFYAEIVFIKVWEKKGFTDYNNENFINEFLKESSKSAAEFRFWALSAHIENTKNIGKIIYYRMLRRKVDKKIKNT